MLLSSVDGVCSVVMESEDKYLINIIKEVKLFSRQHTHMACYSQHIFNIHFQSW